MFFILSFIRSISYSPHCSNKSSFLPGFFLFCFVCFLFFLPPLLLRACFLLPSFRALCHILLLLSYCFYGSPLCAPWSPPQRVCVCLSCLRQCMSYYVLFCDDRGFIIYYFFTRHFVYLMVIFCSFCTFAVQVCRDYTCLWFLCVSFFLDPFFLPPLFPSFPLSLFVFDLGVYVGVWTHASSGYMGALLGFSCLVLGSW